MQTKSLGQDSIISLLVKYSVPAILGMMVNALYNVVDRIFIGNIPGVGSIAIAGMGVTLPIMTIILSFGMLIGVGSTANISLKLGEKKQEIAEKTLSHTVFLCLVIGVLITVFGLIFLEPTLKLFGASEQTIPYSKSYITIILLGSILNLGAFSLNSTMRADGSPKYAAVTMVTGAGANIILDYIFIFIFGWGIAGAAIATVISQGISLSMIIFYYFGGRSNMKIKLKGFKPDMSIIKMIFTIGIAPFSMQLAASLVQVIANNSLSLYGGDMAIAAFAIIGSVNMMILMPIFGLNQGSQPIIGYNYGAKNLARVKKTFIYGVIASTIVTTLGWLMVYFLGTFLANLFTNDPELASLAVYGMKLFFMMLPGVGFVVLASGYFQSCGKAKTAMLLSLLRQALILGPLMYIFPKIWGLDGVWYAALTSDALSIIITYFLIKREFRVIENINTNEELVYET